MIRTQFLDNFTPVYNVFRSHSPPFLVSLPLSLLWTLSSSQKTLLYFPYFWVYVTRELNQGCMHEQCGLVYWGMDNWLVATPLKKNSLSQEPLSITPELGMRSILECDGLHMCGSCAGKHSCCVFTRAMVMSCQKTAFPSSPPHPPAHTFFPPSFPWCSLNLGEGDIGRCSF